jgi:hypothetical protein
MKKITISLISAIFVFQLIGLENIHSQNPETVLPRHLCRGKSFDRIIGFSH